MPADPHAPTACPTTGELRDGRCVPCEGGVPALSRRQAEARMDALDGWTLSGDADSVRREYRAKDFTSALSFFNRVGALAEAEGHHPDLHLTGYRDAAVELRTHAIGGLSENDFILAAKIDALGGP